MIVWSPVFIVQKYHKEWIEWGVSPELCFKRIRDRRYKRRNLLPLPWSVPLGNGDCHHYKGEEVKWWHCRKEGYQINLAKIWNVWISFKGRDGTLLERWRQATVGQQRPFVRPTQDFLTGCHHRVAREEVDQQPVSGDASRDRLSTDCLFVAKTK